jgi:ABC-type uncharacterized transport system involved in gliding motility auxiliary subunit
MWGRRAGGDSRQGDSRRGDPRRRRSMAALLCIAVMLVAVNIIAATVPPVRLDLTAERLYTLSEGTRRTLARIDEPITLRLYYSARLGTAIPSYGVYAQRVRELLDQYVAAANGKLRLEIYQPLPFSDVEDRAVAFGLQGVPLNTQGDQVYFGLAGTNSTDDQQIVAFFAPERERLIEYDLTRLVHSLAFPKRTVVGLISGLPLDGDPMAAARGRASRPTAVLQQLRQLNEVKTLPAALDSIPAGTDVLMLVHPQNLPEKTLFAIDQFVLQGGTALVFVDPYSELQARGARPGTPADSDFERLFKAWGVKILPNTIAGDRRNARRVVVPGGGSAGTGEPRDYIAYLNLRGAELNHDDVITANLRQITMATAGIIEPIDGATTRLEPLVTTSPEAMKLAAEKVAGLPDVAGLLTGFKSENTRYVLAARVTGPAETAFPDGPPKAEEPAKSEPAAKPEAAEAASPHPNPPPPTGEGAKQPAGDFVRKSVQPINLVVVADTDMLDDRFWAQTEDFFGRQVVVPVANNGDFVSNAVEVLAGGENLVGLRSRGTSARPFTLVEQIQRDADDRYAAEQAALQQKLKEAQAKLSRLTQGEGAKANAPLTPEEAGAVDQFRADVLATRRQLRGVQGALRQDIERLKAVLEFADTALVPLLVATAALVLGARRVRRWRRRRSAPA